MRSFGSALAALISVLLISGCAAPKKFDDSGVPEWWGQQGAVDPNYFFGYGTGESLNLSLANNQANADATQDISFKIEQKVDALQKGFLEQVGAGKDPEVLQQFTSVNQRVTSQILSGIRDDRRAVWMKGEKYVVFIRLAYDVGAALEAYKESLESEKDLYTRFRATQAFDDLTKQVDSYHKFKKSMSK